MEHRSEEPLGESSGDEQDWSNRTCGIGCELPSDPENEDEAYYGYGRQEGHAKPNSNQSSRSSTTKQVRGKLAGQSMMGMGSMECLVQMGLCMIRWPNGRSEPFGYNIGCSL